MNEYLILRNKKYYVLNNSEAILLFYKYFLDKPVIIGYSKLGKYISRSFYKLIESILSISYIPFFLKLFIKTKYANESFLIKRKSTKERFSEILLYKDSDNKKYKIRKKYSNHQLVEKELFFIKQYQNLSKSVEILNYKKISNFELETDFIQAPNLWVQAKLGYISSNQVLLIYNNIIKMLDELYINNIGLIHGDLFPINVYYFDNKIILIDFEHAHIFSANYDKYFLLKSLLVAAYGFSNNKILNQYFSSEEIKSFEKHKLELEDQKNNY